MKKLILVLPLALGLFACDEINMFAADLTEPQKQCRNEAVEVAYQVLATIEPVLSSEKIDLIGTIDSYKANGCDVKLVKKALNGMT